MNAIISPDFVRVLRGLDGDIMSCQRVSDVFELRDGWLVGFDSGEWGGALYWFSLDFSSCYQILSRPIVKILRRELGVYIFWGFAHMAENRGGVVQLIFDDGSKKWSVRDVVSLPRKPRNVILRPDRSFFAHLCWDDAKCSISLDWKVVVRRKLLGLGVGSAIALISIALIFTGLILVYR